MVRRLETAARLTYESLPHSMGNARCATAASAGFYLTSLESLFLVENLLHLNFATTGSEAERQDIAVFRIELTSTSCYRAGMRPRMLFEDVNVP